MTWISNQRAWKQVNRIVMSVWILNTQHLENAHTTSMPEASTERLSVRYFYQPKQKISSHPGGYWAKTCMKKKEKNKKLADGDLRFVRHSYYKWYDCRIAHNKQCSQAKVLLKSEWAPSADLIQPPGFWNQWFSFFGRISWELSNPSLFQF